MKKIILVLGLLLVLAGCLLGADKNTDANGGSQQTDSASKNIFPEETITGINDSNTPDNNSTNGENSTGREETGQGTGASENTRTGDLNVPDETSGTAGNQNSPETVTYQVMVSDGTGTPLEHVNVSFSASGRTAFSSEGDTNSDGRISFPNVPIGDYHIVATKEGFDTAIIDGVAGISTTSISITLPARNRPNEGTGRVTGAGGIVWDVVSADGNFAVNPPGFLDVNRNESQMLLKIQPGIIENIANTAFEWRVKVIRGTSTGFPMAVDLYQVEPKKLIKVEHNIKYTKLYGISTKRYNLDLKSDYHTFKLVIGSTENAVLFIDGTEALSITAPSTRYVMPDPQKQLRFDNYGSLVSLDYFYVDLDNDGSWDLKEDWLTAP